MLVNIERAIKNIREDIGFFQPLYEGIINAFQVNANRLDINFDTDTDNNITGYSIKDNGEGFTDENIKSFLTLWSDHHIEQGALGSGRIMCLKVFDNIIIESQTKDIDSNTGQKIGMDFNKTFSPNKVEDIDRQENPSQESWTITAFKNINDSYENINDKSFDQEIIEENILIALLPMFIRFKNEQKKFQIFINDNLWLNKEDLETKIDEYQFETKLFNIEDNNGGQEFTLTYRINNDENDKLEQFYGASDRFITKFPKNTAIDKLPDNAGGIFCLTSEYFENRVKDSRNEFTLSFNQNNASITHPITFDKINDKLRQLLNDILIENFPNIQTEFDALKKELVGKNPHLARQIKANENLTISGNNLLKDAEKMLIKQAQSAKDKANKFVEKLKENTNNFDEESYQKIKDDFAKAGADKLAEYIAYRQTIVDMLIEVDKNNLEKDIHNLFMAQNTASDDYSKYVNNIWIFDDKFMSYNYTASDQTMKSIIGENQEIEPHDAGKKPDLIMLYSDDEDKYKNVLLVEFKKLGCGIDGKMKAISQLKMYPRIIRKYVENVGSIFAYTIIDIDDEFRERLTQEEGFDENAFGDGENSVSSYYNYNKNVKAHINVVSFSQVLQDANKRNTIFLDILREKYEQSI